MPRRTQVILLLVLLVILAGVVYWQMQGPAAATENKNTTVVVGQQYGPINVENPALRKDLLDGIHKRIYPAGRHRDIFNDQPPPPEIPKPKGPVGPAIPAGPPPLVIPATFFGYVADVRTGFRRAFFASGEDVFIVAEGETLMSNFRLLRINNNSVEFEEISSGRKTQLTLEETGPPA
jgi:hypothetical protein